MSLSLPPCSDTGVFLRVGTKWRTKCKANWLQYAYGCSAAHSHLGIQHRHLLEELVRTRWTSHPSLPCSKKSSPLPCLALLANLCKQLDLTTSSFSISQRLGQSCKGTPTPLSQQCLCFAWNSLWIKPRGNICHGSSLCWPKCKKKPQWLLCRAQPHSSGPVNGAHHVLPGWGRSWLDICEITASDLVFKWVWACPCACLSALQAAAKAMPPQLKAQVVNKADYPREFPRGPKSSEISNPLWFSAVPITRTWCISKHISKEAIVPEINKRGC